MPSPPPMPCLPTFPPAACTSFTGCKCREIYRAVKSGRGTGGRAAVHGAKSGGWVGVVKAVQSSVVKVGSGESVSMSWKASRSVQK